MLHLLALTLLFSVLVHPEARTLFTTWATTGTATPRDVNGLLSSEYYSPQLPDISAGPAANYAFGHDKYQLSEYPLFFLFLLICTIHTN